MAIDPATGIYVYDGSEPDYPMDDTLNLLAESTRDAISGVQAGTGLLRTVTPASFITLATGFSYRSGYPAIVRRLADRYEFTFAVTRTSALTHGVVIGTIASQYRPIAGTEWVVNGQQSGGTGSATTISGIVQGSTGSVILHSPYATAVNAQITGTFYRA